MSLSSPAGTCAGLLLPRGTDERLSAQIVYRGPLAVAGARAGRRRGRECLRVMRR